LSAAAVSSVIV